MSNIVLRDYQNDAVNSAHHYFNSGGRSQVIVLPTGAGKSLVLAYLSLITNGHIAIFAHRDVLVEQLCDAFALFKQDHDIVAQRPIINHISTIQMQDHGQSFYNQNSRIHVGSVDTFRAWKRKGRLPEWVKQCELIIIDETHHLQIDNKWGECVESMPHSCKIAGLTATPERGDNKGIGIECGTGYFETMHIGPCMADLIEWGMLTPYKVMVPPNSREICEQLKALRVANDGDYNQAQNASLVDTMKITGDVVDTIQKNAPGKQGIVFCASVTHAEHLAQALNDAGITAAALSSKTNVTLRRKQLQDFRKGKILVLTNYQLFDEGFDVKGIQFVSMVRGTLSYGLYIQMFGRALRLLEGKTLALIFDHVGNSLLHGLPDYGKQWDINPTNKRKNNTDSEVNTTTCDNPECQGVYVIPAKYCPHCYKVQDSEARRAYETAQGDLIELTPEMLAELKGERRRIDTDPETIYNAHVNSGKPKYIAAGIRNQHQKRQDAQRELRTSILNWHLVHFGGMDDQHIINSQYQFECIFKVSVQVAQTLNAEKANKLKARIEAHETRQRNG